MPNAEGIRREKHAAFRRPQAQEHFPQDIMMYLYMFCAWDTTVNQKNNKKIDFMAFFLDFLFFICQN